MSVLPSINYKTKLSTDDLQYQDEVYQNAILERFKLAYGDKSGLTLRYGIVDLYNPTDIVESDTNRPLKVSRSTVDNLRISVSSGTAICPNGAIVTLSSDIFEYQLPRTNLDDVLVVYLENELIEAGESRVSKYNVAGKVRTEQSDTKLRSALLSSYNNPSLFSNSRKEHIVVIAIIKVVSSSTTTSGLDLSIDYSNNSYYFNRPWFSMVDSEHRSSIGSGIVSKTNPHGNSINDFSTGLLSFYSQFLSQGVILSKDYQLKGRPGYSCVETINHYSIQTDTTGEVTKSSSFGGLNKKYIILSSYPASVNSMHLESHLGRSVAFDWIKGTNIVVIPQPEVFTENVRVWYNKVKALEPSTNIVANKIYFSNMTDTKDIAITDGIGLTDIVTDFVEFEGSGPVARKFLIYLNKDGEFLKFPQVLQGTTLLDSIGTELVNTDILQFGPAFLRIALVGATSGPNLSVTIRLFGTNELNAVITEDIKFDSTWSNIVLPSNENLSNMKKTLNVFKTLTGFQVVQRLNDGSASKIIIYSEIETGIAESLSDLLKVSSVEWDGLSVKKVVDERKFKSFLPDYDNRYTVFSELIKHTVGHTHIITEDIKSPKFNEVIVGESSALISKSTLTFSNDVNVGDQVTMSNPIRTLVATNGTPNRSIGEFKIGTASETRDDFILTVNYPAFNSGLTATIDSTNKVILSSNTSGKRGDSTVSITTSVTQAITKTGDILGGIDAHAEAYLSHHKDELYCEIPSTTIYETTNIKERYLSRAFPIDYASQLIVYIHDSKGHQLRYRIANDSLDFGVWITPTTSANYVINSTNITKIQIEIFGRCSGYSIFRG